MLGGITGTGTNTDTAESLESKIVEAKVKTEFLLSKQLVPDVANDNHSLINSSSDATLKRKKETDDGDSVIEFNEGEDETCQPKTKESRKKFRGQNKPKDRPRNHVKEAIQLCTSIALGQPCLREICKFSHDIELYLKSKAPGLPGPCPNILEQSHRPCPFGLRCHFSSTHPTPAPVSTRMDEAFLPTRVGLTKDLQRRLRKKDVAMPTPCDLGFALPLTHREKKALSSTLDFRGKTYLAPLTTVGNLPFRRVCKGFGVDITCGEMALASQIVAGKVSEWALTKRHHSETVFGVQLAGSKPDQLLLACDLLQKHASFDFVDFNLGCPIDSVFGAGCGSALLDRPAKVRGLVDGMVKVLQCPLTAKIRTGVHVEKPMGKQYVAMFSELGVAMTTIHGRSRQQRYRSSADWDYVQQCALEKKHGMQVFGNGDIFHYQQYYDFLEKRTALDGIMVGRAALIKPWIFQEIKERRVFDISSKERLDMLGRFAQYGLAHWGTDTQGLELTRRFFLEFQSFHHRYIPVGLLEYPQYLNQRIPRFIGRDDMETLLASPFVGDWIKLSELFLGPAPDGFRFVPKHKANADASKALPLAPLATSVQVEV